MEKVNIINKFLDKGKLISPGAVEKLIKENNLETFLQKDYDGLVIKEDHFITPEKPKTENIKILKNLKEKPTEIKKEDFVTFYSSKYNKMKDIFINRIKKDFVSLNKIDSIKNEVFIIGMVRDINKQNSKTTIELEDITESKTVVFSSVFDEIEIDDVIAVKAVTGGNVLYGRSVLYPDIPLRPPTKGFGKACFISDLHLDEVPKKDMINFFRWFQTSEIKYLLVAGDLGDNKLFDSLVDECCMDKKVFVIPGDDDSEFGYPTLAEHFNSKIIIPLSNPSMVEINGIKILIIHKADTKMLKKRYLGKSKLILKEDYLVLDQVPDIVHFGHNHTPQIMNYKSVTFVNSGSLLTEFKPIIVDFSSREAEFLKI